MTQRLSLRMYNAQQGGQEWLRASQWVKAMLMAGHRLVMEVRPESKSRDQEKMYHAIIGDIAHQSQHLGAKWEAEDWKRLLLDKFARETGRTHGRIIPNLDSNGVVEVGILSRKFGKADASEFVEWLNAWCAENGIKLPAQIDYETGEIL